MAIAEYENVRFGTRPMERELLATSETQCPTLDLLRTYTNELDTCPQMFRQIFVG
jgi:hypothetical protein